MSDPIDIKALDEYLKGGSEISQRYRELGREDVPPDLDRRVLDEARAAVAGGGGGRSRSWLQWSAPLALAASIVLVVTVVIESGVQENPALLTQPVATDKVRAEPQRQVEEYKLQEQAVAQQAKQEQQAQFAAEPPAAMVPNATPVSAPAAPPPAALAKAAAERSNAVVAEEVRVDAKALRDQSLATSPIAVDTATLDSPAAQVAAEQPSPTFAGSAATTISSRKEVSREASGAPAEADSSDDDVSSVAVTGSRTGRARRTAGPRNTVSNSPFTSETRPAADEEAAQIDPRKWLEEIRELRRAGKIAAADLAWQDFRKAYPQFPVADDDLARKK